MPSEESNCKRGLQINTSDWLQLKVLARMGQTCSLIAYNLYVQRQLEGSVAEPRIITRIEFRWAPLSTGTMSTSVLDERTPPVGFSRAVWVSLQ